MVDRRDRPCLAQIDAMVAGIINAACKAESIPDNPQQRGMDLGNGRGGRSDARLCWRTQGRAREDTGCHKIYPPEGVLDRERREGQAKGVADAVRAALRDQADKILVSCMMLDVADGTWGVNGALWTLPHFAKVAGYQHLQDAN